MSRTATKAAGNTFYEARMEASEMNDRLKSREGAAEELGVDRTRLAKIELGSISPYPEEVLMMTEVYKAPELANKFCKEMCPLGCNIPKAEITDLDRITVRMVASFRRLQTTQEKLICIAEDGVVTPDEKGDMEQVLEDVAKLEEIAHQLKLWGKKYL